MANAMVSFHNLLMIALQLFGGKTELTGFRLLSIAILDMVNTVPALLCGLSSVMV